MIFVTNADGKATYVSPEWHELTGQSLKEAVDFGWTQVLHPEDREITRAVVVDAIRERREFSVRYRVICRDGRHLWLAAGAVPSFGPPDRTFLGFLGSITQIAEALTDGLGAYGSLGRFVPPPSHPATLPATALELVADHLIMAHSLIVQGSGRRALPAVEAALRQIGLELAGVAEGEADATRLH